MKFIATIAGDRSVSHVIMRCMKIISGLFCKIRGHRFATKTVNEKLIKKNTYPLRKSPKQVSRLRTKTLICFVFSVVLVFHDVNAY